MAAMSGARRAETASGGGVNSLMQGFDPEFRDPVHYILAITERIWEGRGVGLIRDWYGAECPVRTPLGATEDVEAVVRGTLETLAAFPDRELLGEEVIIGAKRPGFYSSHRVRSTATHRGGGMFGPPTGRAISMLTIADCLCRDNQVVEEWLVRDQAGIALQLGLDPARLGAEIAGRNPQAAPGFEALLARWADPQGLTVEGDEALARSVIEALARVWADKDLGAARAVYDRAVRLEGPGGEVHHGWTRLDAFLFGVLGAIPDGRWQAHHAVALRGPGRPARVALRWTYGGTHTGHGRYGPPTGRAVALLGISHFELVEERIRSEWMLVDELSVWAQLQAPLPATSQRGE
jgi:predicted ester cyclase